MTAPVDPGADRLEAALTRLGAEHDPPLGWEARVMAAVEARAEPRRPWWMFAVPALTLATAAGVAILVWPAPPSPVLALEVRAEVGPKVRGGSGSAANPLDEDRMLGDLVHVRVSGGTERRAVRIYRNEAILLTCPGDPACRVGDDGIAVDITLDRVGDYAIVAIPSSAAWPEPIANYDTDIAALTRAKVQHQDHMLRVH